MSRRQILTCLATATALTLVVSSAVVADAASSTTTACSGPNVAKKVQLVRTGPNRNTNFFYGVSAKGLNLPGLRFPVGNNPAEGTDSSHDGGRAIPASLTLPAHCWYQLTIVGEDEAGRTATGTFYIHPEHSSRNLYKLDF